MKNLIPLTFKRFISAALVSLPFAGWGWAQQTPEEPKVNYSQARLSILAIGDPPDPSFEIKDGKRVGAEVPESEYPPSMLAIQDKSGGSRNIPLGLNSPVEPIKHPGTQSLQLFAVQEGGGKSLFTQATLPPIPEDVSVYLVRNPRTKSWRSEPLVKVYPSGIRAFPLNSARVINFSRIPVRVEVSGTVFDLAPQAARIVSLKEAGQGVLNYKIGAIPEPNKVVMLVDTATTYSAGSRLNLIAYEADGPSKKVPVKVMNYFELPYTPPAQETSRSDAMR